MNIIGIDSGSSIVKIVELNENDKIIHNIMLEKMPVVQALDIAIEREKIDLKTIQKIVLTGVGKDEVTDNIYGIPTVKIDEFIAIGTGGMYLSKQQEALIASIGTGTAFVRVKNNKIEHIGGTGIGGGTLLNLSKKIANLKEFNDIEKAISDGNLKNVDLIVKDITTEEIETLPKNTTVANFGKLNEKANDEDIILGIINMIFEIIGMMAVFATKNTSNKNIIIIGNLANIEHINIVIEKLEKMHNVKFIIPEKAEFATAIGAIKAAE